MDIAFIIIKNTILNLELLKFNGNSPILPKIDKIASDELPYTISAKFYNPLCQKVEINTIKLKLLDTLISECSQTDIEEIISLSGGTIKREIPSQGNATIYFCFRDKEKHNAISFKEISCNMYKGKTWWKKFLYTIKKPNFTLYLETNKGEYTFNIPFKTIRKVYQAV